VTAATKPQRYLKWENGCELVIGDGRGNEATYWVTRNVFGTYEVRKTDSSAVYVVCPARRTCTCPSHLYRHRCCKHIDAVRKLIALGKIE
jgi:hypothetical protein